MRKILYFHGFLSSPASVKVSLLREGVADRAEILAPDLNLSPLEADRTILAMLERLKEDAQAVPVVIGSSLGGFFAARIAVQYKLRAVLLNPCLNPWDRVREWTGRREIYGTNRTLEVKPSFADDFRHLAQLTDPLLADCRTTMTVLSTADEVLPWKAAHRAFSHSKQLILPNEDHRISNFFAIVPRIVDFCLHSDEEE